MSVRITQSDIDALIDITLQLKCQAERLGDTEMGRKFKSQEHRCRKIYMMLLHASEYGQMTLNDIMTRGFSSCSNLAMAIDALCPLASN